MPCEDVTEVLDLVLDAEDRVESFTLQKQTCGAPVGSRLSLLDFVAGRPAGELIDRSLTQVLPDDLSVKFIDEFMLTKQLGALQGAIGVYLGRAAGGLGEAFVFDGIDFDGERTQISGLLRFDILTAEIEACGGCASCGSAS